jgi:parallel beta-helix repeat protein
MIRIALWLFIAMFVTTAVSKTSDTTKIIFNRDTVLKTDLEIPFGSSLTISEGVNVRLEGYRTITIRGLAICEGTQDRPITFSSVDRARGSAERPTWNGIEIRGKDANGRFRHCRFEGAFRNLAWESNPVFDSCEFTGNHYGLYCTKKAVPHIQNCRFHQNTYGIASDYASPIIAGNIITNNVIGIFLQLSSSALVGRNSISGNQTDIKSEDALGKNKNSFSNQYLWELMQQLF